MGLRLGGGCLVIGRGIIFFVFLRVVICLFVNFSEVVGFDVECVGDCRIF